MRRRIGTGARGFVYAALAALTPWFGFAASASADGLPGSGFFVGGLVGFGPAESNENLGGVSTNGPPGALPFGGAGTTQGTVALTLGKDWRLSERWSVGVEAEASYQAARGESQGSNFFYANFGRGYTESQNASVFNWSVPAQFSPRARVVFQATPAIAIFLAAGPALGAARDRASFSGSSQGECSIFCGGPTIGSGTSYSSSYATSATKWTFDPGFSVAAGVEIAVANNWDARLDYALTAFDPIKQTFANPQSFFGSPSIKLAPLFQDVRLGIVRRF